MKPTTKKLLSFVVNRKKYIGDNPTLRQTIAQQQRQAKIKHGTKTLIGWLSNG
jgi:hypothetical protein